MKRATILIPILLAMGCGHAQISLPATPVSTAASASVARGEYLVRDVSVCGHCQKRMTDDDLRALYRYLRTVPPIRNAVKR